MPLPRPALAPLLLAPILAPLPAGCGADATAPPPPDVPAMHAGLGDLDPAIATAIEEIRAEVRAAPGEVGSWGRLGMVHEANGLADLALGAYGRARELAPEDPKWWHRTALARSKAGRLEGALTAMGRAVELEPDFAPARWRLGLFALELGDLETAADAFRRSIELDPEDPAGWIGLTRVQLQRGEGDAAVRSAERAAGLADDPRYARLLLGSAHRLTGRPEQAEAALRAGAGGRPRWVDPWRAELRALRAQSHHVRMRRAERALAAGRAAEAVPLLRALLDERPDDVALSNLLAQAKSALGSTREARALLERSLEIEPQNLFTRVNLAALLATAGEYETALEHLDRLLAEGPGYGPAHASRGRILALQGDLDGAIEAFRRAVRQDERDVGVRLALGRLELDARRWRDAARTFDAATRARPPVADAFLGLALARARLGELEGATLALERAVEVGSGDPRLAQEVEETLAALRSGEGGA